MFRRPRKAELARFERKHPEKVFVGESGDKFGAADEHPLARELREVQELGEAERLWWISLEPEAEGFPELESKVRVTQFLNPYGPRWTLIPKRYFQPKRKDRTALVVLQLADGRPQDFEEEEAGPGEGEGKAEAKAAEKA